MELGEGKDDEESGKTTDLKGFEKLNVGEMEPTILYHHLYLNLGRMLLPCLLSLPNQRQVRPFLRAMCGLSATRTEVSVTQGLVSFTLFLLGKVRCQQGP